MYIETSDDGASVRRRILTDENGDLRISYVLDADGEPPATVNISDTIRVARESPTESESATELEPEGPTDAPRADGSGDGRSVTKPLTNGAAESRTNGGRATTADSIVGELSDRFGGDPGPIVAGIPAYDEAGSIGSVVRAAADHADEVVVVDDGSTDDTAQQARDAGAKVVEHGRNRGYGHALKTLFDYADRRGVGHLVILDADGQHDPADISTLVTEQRETGAEVVVGNRFQSPEESRPPIYRLFGLKVINLLTNLSMGVARPQSFIGDTQSGFRSYSGTAVESLAATEQISDRMDASVDILFHAHQRNYDVREVPTEIDYDIEDASTHDPIRHGYQLLKNILRTIEQERPLLSVGLPGLLLTLGGIVLASVTVLRYTQTGGVTLELLFGSAVSTLLGFLVCFTAILLHSLQTVGAASTVE